MSRHHHHHGGGNAYSTNRYESANNSNNNNNSKGKESSRHQGIEYEDDSLSTIHSDEDENYLCKDKSGKIANYFRTSSSSGAPNTKPSGSERNAPDGSGKGDDTKDRLTRLEHMLEKLIRRDVQKHNSQTSLPTAEEGVPSKTSQPLFQPPANKKDSNVTFTLEPRNHHFTTSMWISKIQEVAIANDYSESATIRYMESQLTGIVKAWYKNLNQHDCSWPELKLLLTKTFPDNYDFVTTLKRLVTRIKQSDETITNYYYSKMFLIEACRITGEDAVACLIDGLNNQNVQTDAKMQNYLTPETLYAQFLVNLPNYTVDYAPTAVTHTFEETSAEKAKPTLNNWYAESDGKGQHNPIQFPEENAAIHHAHQHHHHHHESEPQMEYNIGHEEQEIQFQTQNLRTIINDRRHHEEKPSVHERLGDRDGPHRRRRSHSRKHVHIRPF